MKKEVRSQPTPLPSRWRSRAARGAQRAPRGAPGASTEASFYVYFTRFSARCPKYIEEHRKVMIEDCFAKIFTRFLNLGKPFKLRGLKRTPKSSRERSQRTSKKAPKTIKITKKPVNSSKNEHAKKHENGTKKVTQNGAPELQEGSKRDP